jgi:ribose transport system permease protein
MSSSSQTPSSSSEGAVANAAAPPGGDTPTESGPRLRKPSSVTMLVFARDRGMIVFWLIMMVAFSIWASPTFGTFNNFMLILGAAAITGIFAGGAALGVLTGLLDLSLPGTAALAGVVSGKILMAGSPVWLALLAAVAMGVAVGLVNGVLTLRGLNSLVVTIGTFSALTGLASVVSGGVPIGGYDRLSFIGTQTYAKIPGPAFVMAAVFILGTVFITQTRAGTRMVAVGGNAEAVRRTGVSVSRYTVLGFVLVSVCAAIGGIVIAAFTSSATPVPDPTILFSALTAVALSGMPLSGGRGSFPRVIVGALIIATVASALTIKNIKPYWVPVITGVLLISALVLERVLSNAVSARLVTLHETKAS